MTSTVYQDATGTLYTRWALRRQAVADKRAEWDRQTQGGFNFNFDDWLIEAVNTGVIKEVDLFI